MSDIFISYKREEQAMARKLANALEGEGWTVWWDPKLRAGEHFDDVIEKALNEAKCVIVMWSNLSVNSEYVKAEATEALEQKKLVPIKIENVNLPFRFKRVHTPSLLDWDGSKDSSDFRKLVQDIAETVGIPVQESKWEADKKKRNRTPQEARAQRRAKKERLRKRSEEETERMAAEATERLLRFRQTAKSKPGTVFRDKLKDGSQGPEMVVIPAGMFQMGDMNGDGHLFERPVHGVRITKPFAMGRYEVTFKEYDHFAAATGRELPNDEGWGRSQQPVINVSWNDVMDYAEWVCQQTVKRYRLPSEAEWEYAARAGSETKYWWGNEMKAGLANCDDGSSKWSGKQPAPVGSFKPNPFGLYDTAGNVAEWVLDCWHKNYDGAPANGSAWKEEGGGLCSFRVTRGGFWGSVPWTLSSSSRGKETAEFCSSTIGFRLIQDID